MVVLRRGDRILVVTVVPLSLQMMVGFVYDDAGLVGEQGLDYHGSHG